jgi:hypothetical protein
MKLCINCKYRLDSEVLPTDPEYSRCGFERPISLVTGLLRSIPELPYCSSDRTRSGRCGLDASNFEAADHVMTPEEEEELMKGMPHE